MISKYLLILGIVHLLGDFYFQSDKIAKNKEDRYFGTIVHALEYFIVSLLAIIPIFHWDMVCAISIMALLHYFIDSIKFWLLQKTKLKKSFYVFIGDQIAHIFCIFMLAYVMNKWSCNIGHFSMITDFINEFGLRGEIIARWLLAMLFIHKPANILIQSFLSEYKLKEDEKIIRVDNKAGRRIGTLERMIMLFFLAINQYTAMGVVLTAKSIARYDKIAKDERFAEYYLMGTLLSTVCVVACKLLI